MDRGVFNLKYTSFSAVKNVKSTILTSTVKALWSDPTTSLVVNSLGINLGEKIINNMNLGENNAPFLMYIFYIMHI